MDEKMTVEGIVDRIRELQELGTQLPHAIIGAGNVSWKLKDIGQSVGVALRLHISPASNSTLGVETSIALADFIYATTGKVAPQAEAEKLKEDIRRLEHEAIGDHGEILALRTAHVHKDEQMAEACQILRRVYTHIEYRDTECSADEVRAFLAEHDPKGGA